MPWVGSGSRVWVTYGVSVFSSRWGLYVSMRGEGPSPLTSRRAPVSELEGAADTHPGTRL